MNQDGELRYLAPGENPGPGWIRLPNLPDRFEDEVHALRELAERLGSVVITPEQEPGLTPLKAESIPSANRGERRREMRKVTGKSAFQSQLASIR